MNPWLPASFSIGNMIIRRNLRTAPLWPTNAANLHPLLSGKNTSMQRSAKWGHSNSRARNVLLPPIAPGFQSKEKVTMEEVLKILDFGNEAAAV